MRCPLARYRNHGSAPIEVRIGELPGEPPYVYRAEPGGAVDGPANYASVFLEAGLVVAEQLGVGEVTAPKAWPGARAAATPAPPPAPAALPPAVPPVSPAPVIIGEHPPPPAPPVPTSSVATAQPLHPPRRRGG